MVEPIKETLLPTIWAKLKLSSLEPDNNPYKIHLESRPANLADFS
jgi:hypothetical protein